MNYVVYIIFNLNSIQCNVLTSLDCFLFLLFSSIVNICACRLPVSSMCWRVNRSKDEMIEEEYNLSSPSMQMQCTEEILIYISIM